MARQTITAFMASLKREMQLGQIAGTTEHHLRREFSEIGWDRDDALHAHKVDEEIGRLETQARTLRRLRVAAFGPMGGGPDAPR
jgi:hypothetical protein